MSTRCQIEIYDDDTPEVMLHHHSDGYPEFMLKKLNTFLEASYQYLSLIGKHYWWDAERVGAVMIMLSIEDYRIPLLPFCSTDRDNINIRANYRFPAFQPSLNYHCDIEYLWKVYIKENGKYEIKCFEVSTEESTFKLKEVSLNEMSKV